MASHALGVRTAGMTSWSLSHARDGAYARPVIRAGWPRPPRTAWTISFRGCRCASGSSSLPKRLRYFLQREQDAVNAVLHSFLRIVEATLQEHSPGAGPRARLGAMSLVVIRLPERHWPGF